MTNTLQYRITKDFFCKFIVSTLILISLNLEQIKAQVEPLQGFKKTVITRNFISEGAGIGDLNKDGRLDIIAGYSWFEAPNWVRHDMATSRVLNPNIDYSDSFLTLGMDVNLDGWDDVVIIGYPGEAGAWLENPKNGPGKWAKHVIADSMGISNELPGFIDIDGDGRLDILCGDTDKKQIVWLQAPTEANQTEWKRFPLSKEGVAGTERYSHGLGFGDIDGDGFKDVVITEGWFKGTGNLESGNWKFHKADLGEPCSQMQVLDINGEGKNDVVSASAHNFGVWWYEQTEDQRFIRHLISNTTSQTHASIMADLNGDGSPDFITGKRYLAHNGKDPGSTDDLLLFWIEIIQKPLYFKEHLIDSDSGVGLNIAVADMNNDGTPDIVVSNKNGVFLFENLLRH